MRTTCCVREKAPGVVEGVQGLAGLGLEEKETGEKGEERGECITEV